jgi:hypothetical protein
MPDIMPKVSWPVPPGPGAVQVEDKVATEPPDDWLTERADDCHSSSQAVCVVPGFAPVTLTTISSLSARI